MPVVEIVPYKHSVKNGLTLNLTHKTGKVEISCKLADTLLSSEPGKPYRMLLYEPSHSDPPIVWAGETPVGEWAALAFDPWHIGFSQGFKVTPFVWQDKAKGKTRLKYRCCSRWLQEYLCRRFPTDPKVKTTVYALKPDLSFEKDGLTFYVIQPKQPKQRTTPQ